MKDVQVEWKGYVVTVDGREVSSGLTREADAIAAAKRAQKSLEGRSRIVIKGKPS